MDFQASSYNGGYQSEEENIGIRKGPWTVEEDSILTQYISLHGEGHWNTAAACAGLKRTGKSCRLRWLNYLRPNVRRGNITLQEQVLILELHSRWGNRWSKIAQHLPGRTDNEIKNYWRTRVQKLAKQLKCDVNSKQFRDAMQNIWIPRLVEKIRFSSGSSIMDQTVTGESSCNGNSIDQPVNPNITQELSGNSLDSLDSNQVVQVSSSSDPTNSEIQNGSVTNLEVDSGRWGWYNQNIMDSNSTDIQSSDLLTGVDLLDSFWEDESFLLFQEELL